MGSDFSAGDVEAWLEDERTKYFFGMVKLELAECDKQVHEALLDNQPTPAMIENAGKMQLEEVLDLPRLMKEQCEEE